MSVFLILPCAHPFHHETGVSGSCGGSSGCCRCPVTPNSCYAISGHTLGHASLSTTGAAESITVSSDWNLRGTLALMLLLDIAVQSGSIAENGEMQKI